ncbi:MAG: L-lactate dehydrogenase [Clostridiales bacterium]
MRNISTKISIIGAGFVGSTTAYTIMTSGLVSEIVLVDISKDKSDGEVMDLNHGMPFTKPVKVYSGTYEDTKNSDIVIITAGANQKPNETRIDLVEKNVKIFKNILSELLKYNDNSILLVVTNPVDILTYITYKYSGFPKNRVIGSGTVLDTARFRYLLADHTNIDPRNVHAYIIGEHGDTEVPAWSLANIAGISMDKYCDICNGCDRDFTKSNIFNQVKSAAYEIIQKKGATYYAVALAVNKIVETILRDENSILTVSSFLENKYGLNDICISVPTIVNKNGVERILELPLSTYEHDLLKRSSDSLKGVINKLNL